MRQHAQEAEKLREYRERQKMEQKEALQVQEMFIKGLKEYVKMVYIFRKTA